MIKGESLNFKLLLFYFNLFKFNFISKKCFYIID